MKSPLEYIAPFFITGIAIVVFVIGFFIFSYILIFAAIVGLVLFVIAYIRVRFFMSKDMHQTTVKKEQGRLIEHDHEAK